MPKPLAYFNSRKAKVNAEVNRGLRNGISNHGEWGWQIRVFLSEEKCKCFSGSADGHFDTSGRMNMARPISSLEICSILKGVIWKMPAPFCRCVLGINLYV